MACHQEVDALVHRGAVQLAARGADVLAPEAVLLVGAGV